MQIHKKDIVWPEAGVVRKRGIEREKRQEKTFSLAFLFALQYIPVSFSSGKYWVKGGENAFLFSEIMDFFQALSFGGLPQKLIN